MHQLQKHEQPEKVVVKLAELEEKVRQALFLSIGDRWFKLFAGKGT